MNESSATLAVAEPSQIRHVPAQSGYVSESGFRIIGIAGPAGSGKDTVAQRLIEKHSFMRYALADPLKNVLNDLFGWTQEQWADREWKERVDDHLGFSPRRAAQTLGTEWGRALHPLLWLKIADSYIEASRAMNNLYADIPAAGIVIPDIRFENEADWLRQKGLLIHVVRDGCVPVEAHSSEAGVAYQEGDATVHNNRDIAWAWDQVDALMG